MQKILISWEAYWEDFESRKSMNRGKRDDKALHTGPTFSLHRHFDFDYSKHIILSSAKNEEDKRYSALLLKELKDAFPKRTIEGKSIELEDPLNIAEIFKKVNDLISSYRNSQIDVFISTGSPNMRVVWFLLQPNFKQNLRLFQIREAKFSPDNKPQKVYVDIDEFDPNAINILSEISNQKVNPDKILIPETLKPIYNKAELIARTYDVGCLILGENGTGKENLASYIHSHSERSKNPFRAINCAAYTDDLLRSELFGYEKDAFTGANKQKKGIFEESDGGTIFLDEIGDISNKMQVSLLRVLQEKKIQRVGGIDDLPIDVRVIAATNKDLEDQCEQGLFRWDLFFRMATTTLKLPALRNWTISDKKELIDHFVNIYLPEFRNRTKKLQFDNEAYQMMVEYHYRGNVRELQNLIISLYTFCDKEVTIKDLPDRMFNKKNNIDSNAENEKAHTLKILKDKYWNILATSKALNISRQTLYGRIRKYGLTNDTI